MRKTLITYFILFLIAENLRSQDDFCGTVFTQAEIDQIAQLAQARDIFTQNFILQKNASAAQPIQSVPVQIHIVRRSDGSGGVPTSEIKTGLAVVNNYYINANIQFVVCNPVNFIDNDVFYSLNPFTEEFTLASANDASNAINLYFVNSFETVEWGGYYRPGTDRLFTKRLDLIGVNLITDGLVLSHEIGHYFDLLHTNGGACNQVTNELVDGSNCIVAGDFICDTPADPNCTAGLLIQGPGNICQYPWQLALQVCSNPCNPLSCNFSCKFCDVSGSIYTPLPHNIMFCAKCLTNFNQFTTGQYAAIALSLLNHRFYLKPADFDLVLNDNPFNGDIVYKAHNTITAQQTFKADVNDKVTLLAGNEITLSDGFIAEQGTDFVARIQNFGNFCSPITLRSLSEESQNSTDQNSQYNQKLMNGNNFSITPNPSSTNSVIQYSVESIQPVSILLYDIFGKQMMELVNVKEHQAGNFVIRLEDTYLPAGIYFCNIRKDNYVKTKKLILLKSD